MISIMIVKTPWLMSQVPIGSRHHINLQRAVQFNMDATSTKPLTCLFAAVTHKFITSM